MTDLFEIRRAFIETDLAEPNRLLSNSSLCIHPSAFPPCLWFLAKNKNTDAKRGFPYHHHPTTVFSSTA